MTLLLRFYDRLAARLFAFRALFWVLAAGALAGFAATLFVDASPRGPTWLFLALVVLLWALCALVILHSFVHAPPAAGPGAAIGLRLRAWFARAGRGVLAVVMTALNLAVLWLTVKAVTLLASAP